MEISKHDEPGFRRDLGSRLRTALFELSPKGVRPGHGQQSAGAETQVTGELIRRTRSHLKTGRRRHIEPADIPRVGTEVPDGRSELAAHRDRFVLGTTVIRIHDDTATETANWIYGSLMYVITAPSYGATRLALIRQDGVVQSGTLLGYADARPPPIANMNAKVPVSANTAVRLDETD